MLVSQAVRCWKRYLFCCTWSHWHYPSLHREGWWWVPVGGIRDEGEPFVVMRLPLYIYTRCSSSALVSTCGTGCKCHSILTVPPIVTLEIVYYGYYLDDCLFMFKSQHYYCHPRFDFYPVPPPAPECRLYVRIATLLKISPRATGNDLF